MRYVRIPLLIIALLCTSISHWSTASMGRDESLLHAALRGDFQAVERLCVQGALLGVRSRHGKNVLMLACKSGDVTTISLILDIMRCHRCWESKKMPTVVRSWIHKRFHKNKPSELHINAADSDGKTALLEALELGREDIVKLLLEQGANPNQGDESGKPLTYALRYCRPAVLRLVRYGAVAENDSIFGQVIRIVFAKRKVEQYLHLLRWLIKQGANANVVTHGRNTLLIDAVRGNHIAFVRFLVEHHADINVREEHQLTPLMIAAAEGKNDMTACLIRVGATLDLAEVRGRTALYLAAYKRHYTAAKCLLDSGADPNRASLKGCGPLEVVIGRFLREHSERDGYLIKLLLRAGAYPDSSCPRLMLSLIRATEKSNWSLALRLLRYGADAKVTDKAGRTVVDLALSFLRRDVACRMIIRGAPIPMPLFYSEEPAIATHVLPRHDVLVNILDQKYRLPAVLSQLILKDFCNEDWNFLEPYFVSQESPLACRLLQFAIASNQLLLAKKLIPGALEICSPNYLAIALHCGNQIIAQELVERGCSMPAMYFECRAVSREAFWRLHREAQRRSELVRQLLCSRLKIDPFDSIASSYDPVKPMKLITEMLHEHTTIL